MTDPAAPSLSFGLPYRVAHVNGIDVRYLDVGSGPLILLLHGFPDFSYTWRHLLSPLAGAGFRVVAPDLRGSGGSSRPSDTEGYTYFHVIGDLVGLMDELCVEQAVVVGHDMGAYVAMHMALIVPARVRAVASLSIPLRKRPPRPPLTLLETVFGPRFYQIQFQVPDAPEADLERHLESFLPGILVGLSADAPHPITSLVLDEGAMFSDLFPMPDRLPGWLTEADCAAYIETFRKTGFDGALGSYRNIDRNWELLGPWASAIVSVPAMYITGDQDIAYTIARASGTLEEMPLLVPDLRRSTVLADTGHWLTQEKPAELTAELLGFLGELYR